MIKQSGACALLIVMSRKWINSPKVGGCVIPMSELFVTSRRELKCASAQSMHLIIDSLISTLFSNVVLRKSNVELVTMLLIEMEGKIVQSFSPIVLSDQFATELSCCGWFIR